MAIDGSRSQLEWDLNGLYRASGTITTMVTSLLTLHTVVKLDYNIVIIVFSEIEVFNYLYSLSPPICAWVNKVIWSCNMLRTRWFKLYIFKTLGDLIFNVFILVGVWEWSLQRRFERMQELQLRIRVVLMKMWCYVIFFSPSVHCCDCDGDCHVVCRAIGVRPKVLDMVVKTDLGRRWTYLTSAPTKYNY